MKWEKKGIFANGLELILDASLEEKTEMGALIE